MDAPPIHYHPTGPEPPRLIYSVSSLHPFIRQHHTFSARDVGGCARDFTRHFECADFVLPPFNTPLRLLESNTQIASLVIPNLMGGKSTTVAFFSHDINIF